MNQHRLFALSPVVASGSAYLLNVVLIYILNDKIEYSQFLSLNAWAVYLSTFSYLLIIDLYLGPNRERYQLDALLGLSGLFIAAFVSVLIITAAVLSSIKMYAITSGILGFAGFKLACQYFIYHKQIAAVALLRYLRAGLILLVIGVLLVLREQFTLSGALQVTLQGMLCVVVLLVTQFFYGLFRQTGIQEVGKVLRLDGVRLLKRNAAMIVDTVHVPVFYQFVSIYSDELSALFIYALGVLLPAAYVMSTIMREQVLVRDRLVEKVLGSRYGVILLMGYGLVTIIAGFFVLNGSTHSHLVLTLLLAALISFSGAIGTVLYRRGLESYDLSINLFISSLLAVLYFYSQRPDTVWVVEVCLLCLVFKFCMQMMVAFVSVRRSV